VSLTVRLLRPSGGVVNLELLIAEQLALHAMSHGAPVVRAQCLHGRRQRHVNRRVERIVRGPKHHSTSSISPDHPTAESPHSTSRPQIRWSQVSGVLARSTLRCACVAQQRISRGHGEQTGLVPGRWSGHKREKRRGVGPALGGKGSGWSQAMLYTRPPSSRRAGTDRWCICMARCPYFSRRKAICRASG
jgi:hypothetical protein